jgi:hypothetical protein
MVAAEAGRYFYAIGPEVLHRLVPTIGEERVVIQRCMSGILDDECLMKQFADLRLGLAALHSHSMKNWHPCQIDHLFWIEEQMVRESPHHPRHPSVTESTNSSLNTSDYAKDSEVFIQGADAESIFYLQKGRATAAVISEQATETIVGISDACQFFGDGCLSGQPQRITTTKASTDNR